MARYHILKKQNVFIPVTKKIVFEQIVCLLCFFVYQKKKNPYKLEL